MSTSATATPPPPTTNTPLLNVQIDGRWLQFPKGTRLIEACKQAGKFIPHYCYHPKLSSPGNCRMCLVELGSPKLGPDRKPLLGDDGRPIIAWNPRPAISCATEISEGMAVRTDSPLVRDCRNAVMEFLLINHPLDCPICDQAGECRLQEFSVQYGKGESRFLEEKVKKPKRVDIGKHIILDDERCILCSRCIRFMQEIAKDDVLGFIQRGSHTTLTVHPGRRLDNNYSLNTVDICPVGALTSKDFRFKMRVWFLKETKSIDVNCGTGSNILIGSRENTIYRITPRENDAVNSCWLPDSHRLNFYYISREDRLKKPILRQTHASWSAAISSAAQLLSSVPPTKIALLASARSTLEELYLIHLLLRHLRIDLYDILPRPQPGDGFLIAPDGNPNTNGARLLQIAANPPGSRLEKIAASIRSRSTVALLTLGEDATKIGISDSDLQNLDFLIALDILPNRTTPHATVLLPAAAFAEKRGSMINLYGRLQRLNKAIQPPPDARDDWEIYRDLLNALPNPPPSIPQTFDQIWQLLSSHFQPLAGLSFAKIGDLGVQLNLPWVENPGPPPRCMPDPPKKTTLSSPNGSNEKT